MGTNTAIEGPTTGPGSAVLAGVVTAPPVTPRVGGPYSLQDAPVDPSPGSYHTEEDDNEDNSSREERLLPERPRRSSFDVAMHEDPLFNTRHPCARKLRMAFKKAWGLVLMIIASALLSTATLVVSLLSTKFSTWELSAWRLFGQWICTLIYVRIYKTSLRFEQKAMGAMVLRCFAGLGSMLFLYMAIRHMAMANATIIRYTSPVMVCVLAKIVSDLRWWPWLLLFLTPIVPCRCGASRSLGCTELLVSSASAGPCLSRSRRLSSASAK